MFNIGHPQSQERGPLCLLQPTARLGPFVGAAIPDFSSCDDCYSLSPLRHVPVSEQPPLRSRASTGPCLCCRGPSPFDRDSAERYCVDAWTWVSVQDRWMVLRENRNDQARACRAWWTNYRSAYPENRQENERELQNTGRSDGGVAWRSLSHPGRLICGACDVACRGNKKRMPEAIRH